MSRLPQPKSNYASRLAKLKAARKRREQTKSNNASRLAKMKAARKRREQAHGGSLSTYKGAAAKPRTAQQTRSRSSKPARDVATIKPIKRKTTPSRPKMHASGMTQDQWDRFSGKTKTYQRSTPGKVNQNYYIDQSGRTRNEKGRIVGGRELDRLKRVAGTSRYERKDDKGNVIFSRSIPQLKNVSYDPDASDLRGRLQKALAPMPTSEPTQPTNLGGGDGSERTLNKIGEPTSAPAPTSGPKPEPTYRFGNDLEKYLGGEPTPYQGVKIAPPDFFNSGVSSPFGGTEAYYTGEEQKTPLSQDMTPPTPYDSMPGIRKGERPYMDVFGGGTYGSGIASQGAMPEGGGVQDEFTERYKRELELQQLAEQQAQENYDKLKNQYASERDEQMRLWDQSAESKYGDLMDKAAENTERTTKELMRFKGSKGTARSSRTMDAVKQIQEKGSEVQENLLRERDRERALYEAQLRGVEGEALLPYIQNLQDARTKRQGTEAVLAAAEQGLLMEQQQAGEEARLAEQQQYIDYLKQIGMAMHPETGETVETLQAQLDKAKAMKDMGSAEKYFADAARINKALENNYEMDFTTDGQGNRLAVWYDPSKPGEMQSATVGKEALAPGAGGGGGSYGGGYGGGYGGDSGGGGAETEVSDDFIDTIALELAAGGHVGEGGEPEGAYTWDEINKKVSEIPVSVGVKKEILDRTAGWKMREVQ